MPQAQFLMSWAYAGYEDATGSVLNFFRNVQETMVDPVMAAGGFTYEKGNRLSSHTLGMCRRRWWIR